MFQSTLLLVLLSSANAFPATPSASSTARDFCLNEQNVNGKYKVDPSKGALDKGWMSLGCTIKEVVDTDVRNEPCRVCVFPISMFREGFKYIRTSRQFEHTLYSSSSPN